VEALCETRQRGILLTGSGAFIRDGLPDELLALDSAPHDWLFPRMAAVVHHGGAGTTAAALRAGVPSIVVPFFADQPHWARTVHDLGVGPGPIPHRRLTADRLAEAIERALSDEDMRARAGALGQRIRAEDGVARAVEIIREHFGGP
jgi:UDP:flavonoid glycosyltransferase YjiC (YdhE family)